MRQRQSRWSPDHASTCPLHLAVTCSVSAALEEHKKTLDLLRDDIRLGLTVPHVRASVYGVWVNFTCILRQGGRFCWCSHWENLGNLRALCISNVTTENGTSKSLGPTVTSACTLAYVPVKSCQLLACHRHGDWAVPYMARASSSLQPIVITRVWA